MDNISQDKQKLLKIMQELKKDYQAGNISENKYRFLSKEYSNRLANLDATNRIRNMQGRKNAQKSHSKAVQRSMAEASKREDKALVDKYVVRQSPGRMNPNPSQVSNKSKYAVVAVIFLIGAFLIGISFGLFTGGPQSNVPVANILIDDTSFPEVISNVTDIVVNPDNIPSGSNSKNNNTIINNNSTGNSTGNGTGGSGNGTGGSGSGGTGNGSGGSGSGGSGKGGSGNGTGG